MESGRTSDDPALSGLSASQLAGQLMVGGFEGADPPPDLLEALRAGERAGVILFRRNLPAGTAGLAHVRELCRTIRQAAPLRLPACVSIDEEGGRVQRLQPPALQLPALRQVADAWGPPGLERLAFAVGRQLTALGFTLNFAPVVDVDTNPRNPIIGDRALGSSPERVVDRALAYLRGLRRAGLASCIKHFPGHGDSDVDSHLALPVLNHDRARLDAIELAPFRALVDKADSAMVGHLLVSALDNAQLASLSPRVLALLKAELGFNGPVFTDALEMKALTGGRLSLGEAAVAAVSAGCDVTLPCDTWSGQLEVHAALTRAIERSADFAQRAQDAATRSLRLRRQAAPISLLDQPLEAVMEGASQFQQELDELTAPPGRS